MSLQSNTSESEFDLLFSDLNLDLDKELGDQIGLLFTDAAHTVLGQLSHRRKSLWLGSNQ